MKGLIQHCLKCGPGSAMPHEMGIGSTHRKVSIDLEEKFQKCL